MDNALLKVLEDIISSISIIENNMCYLEKLDKVDLGALGEELEQAKTELEDDLREDSLESLETMTEILERVEENWEGFLEVPSINRDNFPSIDKYLDAIKENLMEEVNRLKS